MHNIPASAERFAQEYEVEIGGVAGNLSILKQLLERDYLLREPEAESYLKVCAMLLANSCRMLGEALAQEFEDGSVLSNPDDLRKRRTTPLFTKGSLTIGPLEIVPVVDGPFLLCRSTEMVLTHEQIQQIHEAAEDVLFRPDGEPRMDFEAAYSSLKEGHDHLADNLREHLVDLPEWGLVLVVQIFEADDVRCALTPSPSNQAPPPEPALKVDEQ